SDMFFLPDHDLGVVVLTNAAGANAFRGAERRRLLQLVFDSHAEAKDDPAAALARQETSLADERALQRPEPDWAWVTPLLGASSEPSLGGVSIHAAGARLTLDAGEWKSDLVQKVDRDGTQVLTLVSPPLAGM